MTVSEELAARALGRLAIKLLNDVYQSDYFSVVTDGLDTKALQEIQDILGKEDLTDFECIEEIVLIFERYGISTSRHDFG